MYLFSFTALKKYLLIVVVLSFGVLLGQSAGWAQTLNQEVDFFDTIKSEMMSESEAGATFVEENKALKGQLIGLQLEVEQLERESEKLDSGYRGNQKRERERATESFNFKGMGSDELVQEAQNIYLSGQLMPLDDVQRLRELQLYELQYCRQELGLELQLVDFLCRKTKEIRKPQMEALEKGIEDNRAGTREILALIAEEKRKSFAFPRQIELLKMENKSLKQRIRELKRYVK